MNEAKDGHGDQADFMVVLVEEHQATQDGVDGEEGDGAAIEHGGQWQVEGYVGDEVVQREGLPVG